MSKSRWIVLGAVLGFALSLTLGSALAAGRWSTDRSTEGGTVMSSEDPWGAMDAMHDSPWMEQMRERMGAELAAQCDRLHDQVMERARDRDGTGSQDRDRLRDHAADPTGPGYGPGGMMGGFGPGSGPGWMMGGPGYGYGPGGMMGGSGPGSGA